MGGRPWTRRNPMPAALLVGVGAYGFLGSTLALIGGVEPADAWGLSTAVGAAVVAFVAWAVFSRPEREK